MLKLLMENKTMMDTKELIRRFWKNYPNQSLNNIEKRRLECAVTRTAGELLEQVNKGYEKAYIGICQGDDEMPN